MSRRLLSFDVGTKNLAFCDLTVAEGGSFKIHGWTVATTVARGVNVNKTPLWDLAPPFAAYVRAHAKSWLFEADGAKKPFDAILIENQPMGGRGAARNLKTKVLSHILQVALLELRPELPLTFIHPGFKLRDMPRPLEGGRTTYRDNKLFAIAETTRYVTSAECENPADCEALYVSKKMKKDDLADAFLQGLIVGRIMARGDVVATASDDKPKKPRVKKTATEGAVAAVAEEGAVDDESAVVAEDAVAEEAAVEAPTKPPAKKKNADGPAVKKKRVREAVAEEALDLDAGATEAAVEAAVEATATPKRGRPTKNK